MPSTGLTKQVMLMAHHHILEPLKASLDVLLVVQVAKSKTTITCPRAPVVQLLSL